MSILDIIKEVPLSSVLRERIELEQSKSEFAISRANTERDDFKAKFEQSAAALDNEQKEHALTHQKLKEALEKIGWLSGQSQTIPNANLGARIPKFKSFK